MRYPLLKPRPYERKSISRFRGLNRNPRPRAGDLSDMKNLSSDAYPVLSPRGKRGIYRRPASPQGLIARDVLCYVDGTDFILGNTRIPMGLSVAPEDCPKRLQSMGAYVIILPDKKYINTARPEDFGDIEARTETPNVRFTLCKADGAGYGDILDSAPENPENGSLWLDASSSPARLMQYSAPQGQWVQITTTGRDSGCPLHPGDAPDSGAADAPIAAHHRVRQPALGLLLRPG